MEKTIVRRRNVPGIEITIKERRSKFDLFIDIAPGTDISKKIKGDGFSLKLTYSDKATKVKEPLHYEKIKKPCNCKKGQLVDALYIIQTKEYKLSVILQPTFYAPTAMIEMMEKNRGKKQKKQPKKKMGAVPPMRGFSSSSSRATPYTRNNAFKPYQGGGCCPK